ncbi:MAG: hypothetical protein LBB42_05100 [Coriobacteriales bacterium]|jgi:HPt (histidine-containing phosphotransfer) domain-containing protein|nr:hypothetical protein [Coriobacteriales bacterium]
MGLDDILANTNIEGLNIPEALGRINNNSSIYMRIIHSFTQNMPDMLEELSKVTEADLPDYIIQVHGAKGSCYGIGATACGDAAFALEMASKAGDWETVARDNGAFIALSQELVEKLKELEACVEQAQSGAGAGAGGVADGGVAGGGSGAAGGSGTEADAVSEAAATPAVLDTEKLAALLEATKDFDYEKMESLVEDLEKQRYANGDEIVPWLREQLDKFSYDTIIERLSNL